MIPRALLHAAWLVGTSTASAQSEEPSAGTPTTTTATTTTTSAGELGPPAFGATAKVPAPEPGGTRMTLDETRELPGALGDPLRVMECFSKFLPVGFYYKAFHTPRRLFPFYENQMRKVAGLGKINSERPCLPSPKDYAFCDLLVVGAEARFPSLNLRPDSTAVTIATANFGCAAGTDDDGDGLCDDEDPCDVTFNPVPFNNPTGDGRPTECRCGDFNQDGFHTGTDLFLQFGCTAAGGGATPAAVCLANLPFGEANNDGFYTGTDLFLTFGLTAAGGGASVLSDLTCAAWPGF